MIVDSNYDLSARTTVMKTTFGTGCHLRIFVNNLTPTPANVIGDFTEASWGGYAAISLSGQWTGPTKIVDGEYEIVTGTYTFTKTSGTDATAYGYYVEDGTGCLFSERFAAPITVVTGTSFTLQVKFDEYAKSIL